MSSLVSSDGTSAGKPAGGAITHVSFSDSSDGNAAEIQRALSDGPTTLQLPAGTFDIRGGLRLGDGQQLIGQRGAAGRPSTRLRPVGSSPEPFIRVLGSSVTISDVALDVPTASAGEHHGDLGTAVTVGRYLYPQAPQWIENLRLERLVVERTGRRRNDGLLANTVAIMGAVRDVTVEDVDIRGGGTGVAVHWGACSPSVRDIAGPTYHPHHLRVRGLRVADAFEGFYLSSVHDVSVEQADLDRVEIGFRLLPGDNTARFAQTDPPTPVSSRIKIADCRISWHGNLYAVRAAGWGRSLVDGRVTLLPFESAVIRRCVISTAADRIAPRQQGNSRAAIVLEQAHGLVLEDVAFEAGAGINLVRTDGAAPSRLGTLIVG